MKIIFKIIIYAIGLPIIYIIEKIDWLVSIRFIRLHYKRIGHLSANTELYLRRRSISKQKGLQVDICISGKPANHQLLKMIKRKIIVIESKIILKIYHKLKAKSPNSKVWIELPMNTNEFYEFSNIPPQLSFTSSEHNIGKSILKSMNIKENDKFICFHARDKSYMEKSFPKQDNTKQDYRNSNIINSIPATEYITDLNMWAIRIGSIVEKPIANNNPKMIDYALNFRSDFGDIYLLKHCKFFLSSSPTGIQTVASMVGTPIVSPNRIPIGDIPLNYSDIFIPMKYQDKKTKKLLTYKEVINIGGDRWFDTQNYIDNGIELIENTSEEILEVTKEMNERLNGTWMPNPIDEELQQMYCNLFEKGNHIYNFTPRIGADFLRKNQNLLN